MSEKFLKSLGSAEPVSSKVIREKMPFKSLFSGLAVLAVLFVIAVIAAMNDYSVLGWVIVAVNAAWLLVTTVAVVFWIKFVSLKRLSSRDAKVIHQCPGAAQCAINSPNNRGGAVSKGNKATPLLQEEKIAHNFEIIRVQSRVVLEQIGADADKARQAAQVIGETATQGKGLIEG